MNRNGRKTLGKIPAVGGSSLLVMFAILCLTTLAVLSLTSAKSSVRLADSTHQAVEQYYSADWKAEEILSRIRSGEIPEGVERQGDLYEYTCEISETQELQVQVRVEGQDWEVLRWKAVSRAESKE